MRSSMPNSDIFREVPIGFFTDKCEVRECPGYGPGQRGIFVKTGCTLYKGDIIGSALFDVFMGREFSEEGRLIEAIYESLTRQGEFFLMPMWVDEDAKVYAKMIYHPETIGFPLNYCHLFNHKSDPNVDELEYFKGDDASKFRVLYVVKSDIIKSGEELFTSYGYQDTDLAKSYSWLKTK